MRQRLELSFQFVCLHLGCDPVWCNNNGLCLSTQRKKSKELHSHFFSSLCSFIFLFFLCQVLLSFVPHHFDLHHLDLHLSKCKLLKLRPSQMPLGCRCIALSRLSYSRNKKCVASQGISTIVVQQTGFKKNQRDFFLYSCRECILKGRLYCKLSFLYLRSMHG